MKAFHFGAMGAVLLSLIALGCGDNASPQNSTADKQARIQANLEKLDPADRELAQEQKYCPIMTEKQLGEMGKPIKMVLNDQTLFVCCKGCEKAATKNPDKTLDALKKLKTASTPGASDASSETR